MMMKFSLKFSTNQPILLTSLISALAYHRTASQLSASSSQCTSEGTQSVFKANYVLTARRSLNQRSSSALCGTACSIFYTGATSVLPQFQREGSVERVCKVAEKHYHDIINCLTEANAEIRAWMEDPSFWGTSDSLRPPYHLSLNTVALQSMMVAYGMYNNCTFPFSYFVHLGWLSPISQEILLIIQTSVLYTCIFGSKLFN